MKGIVLSDGDLCHKKCDTMIQMNLWSVYVTFELGRLATYIASILYT